MEVFNILRNVFKLGTNHISKGLLKENVIVF